MKEYDVTLTVTHYCSKRMLAESEDDLMKKLSKLDNLAVDITDHPTLEINNEIVKVEHIEIFNLNAECLS